MIATDRRANLRGASLMVLAMLGFAIEDAFFKSATQTVSPGLATLIFGTIGFVIFLALGWRAGERLWSPAFLSRAMIWRSVFEIAGRLFYALALAFVPLATASAILQAAPLVVTLGAALVLGDKVGAGRWIAMAVGFAGVLTILRPFDHGFSPALLFAVAGTIGFAGRDLATRASSARLSSRHLGAAGFAMVMLAGIVILAVEPPAAAPDAGGLMHLAGAGIVGVLAYSALTGAMRIGEISVVAPFRYSRLLIAIVLAALLFGERPDLATLVGGVLIVGSGIYTLVRSGRAPKTA